MPPSPTRARLLRSRSGGWSRFWSRSRFSRGRRGCRLLALHQAVNPARLEPRAVMPLVLNDHHRHYDNKQYKYPPHLLTLPFVRGRNPNRPHETSGEPAGTRTRDPLIKSQMLYRLSYGLSACRPYGRACAKVNIKGRWPLWPKNIMSRLRRPGSRSLNPGHCLARAVGLEHRQECGGASVALRPKGHARAESGVE